MAPGLARSRFLETAGVSGCFHLGSLLAEYKGILTITSGYPATGVHAHCP